jgi:hypothetical protein
MCWSQQAQGNMSHASFLLQPSKANVRFRGLGAVICQKFAAEGCNVAINYHSSREVAEELASRLAKEYSIKCIILQGVSLTPGHFRGSLTLYRTPNCQKTINVLFKRRLSNYPAWTSLLQMLGGLGSLINGTFMTCLLRNGTRQDTTWLSLFKMLIVAVLESECYVAFTTHAGR